LLNRLLDLMSEPQTGSYFGHMMMKCAKKSCWTTS